MVTLRMRSQKAQVRTLNDELEKAGESPEALCQLDGEKAWLIDRTIRSARELKEEFERKQKTTTALPVETLLEFHNELLELIDLELRLSARVQERASEAAETTGEIFDPTPMVQAADDLLQLRMRVAGLSEWLESPTPSPACPTGRRRNARRPSRKGSTRRRKNCLTGCDGVGLSSRNDPMEWRTIVTSRTSAAL